MDRSGAGLMGCGREALPSWDRWHVVRQDMETYLPVIFESNPKNSRRKVFKFFGRSSMRACHAYETTVRLLARVPRWALGVGCGVWGVRCGA